VGVTESVAWLERYSAVILPVLVVAEQIGVPLPAVPALLVVGALAAQGRVSLVLVIGGDRGGGTAGRPRLARAGAPPGGARPFGTVPTLARARRVRATDREPVPAPWRAGAARGEVPAWPDHCHAAPGRDLSGVTRPFRALRPGRRHPVGRPLGGSGLRVQRDHTGARRCSGFPSCARNRAEHKGREQEQEAVTFHRETDIHSTRNDLSESIRTKAIELLDARLADATDLQTQLKQAHWNVKDPTFTFAAHIERGDRAVEAGAEGVDWTGERTPGAKGKGPPWR
jgi:hypothetical protein